MTVFLFHTCMSANARKCRGKVVLCVITITSLNIEVFLFILRYNMFVSPYFTVEVKAGGCVAMVHQKGPLAIIFLYYLIKQSSVLTNLASCFINHQTRTMSNCMLCWVSLCHWKQAKLFLSSFGLRYSFEFSNN